MAGRTTHQNSLCTALWSGNEFKWTVRKSTTITNAQNISSQKKYISLGVSANASWDGEEMGKPHPGVRNARKAAELIRDAQEQF